MQEHSVKDRMYIPDPPRKSRGLLTAASLLAAALVLVLVTGAFVVMGLQDDLARTERTLAATSDDLEDSETANEDLERDLDDAESRASSCADAAELLARGADGYADLWNELDEAVDRWRYVFDFYLRGIMRRTNVTNATLNAGWDALANCDSAGGGTAELA